MVTIPIAITTDMGHPVRGTWCHLHPGKGRGKLSSAVCDGDNYPLYQHGSESFQNSWAVVFRPYCGGESSIGLVKMQAACPLPPAPAPASHSVSDSAGLGGGLRMCISC